MLICHCERVNDRRIRQAVAGGARTVAQVGRSCRAGTCCGGCAPAISQIIEEKAAQESRPLPVVAAREADLVAAAE